MAPNRKNVSNLLSTLSSSDLASLQQSVQPKYLPLTHPQEESKHLEEQEQQQESVAHAKQPQAASVSYWDWPTEDIKEDEEEPVVVDDLFSASRIEANLIKSAQASAEAESKTVADHDDYWAEASEQDVQEEKEVIRAPQHLTDAGYWEWSANETETTTRRILADEQARVKTSVEYIERLETSNSRQTTSPIKQVHSQKESNDSYWQWNSTKVSSHVDDASHPNANYWDWEAKPESSMVQSIMEYEAARELLKASTIVQQLQRSSVPSCGATNASSDAYWNFSEQYGDEYWQEQRQAPSAVTTGYWDW